MSSTITDRGADRRVGASVPLETRLFAIGVLLALAAVPTGLAGLDPGTQLRVAAVPALLLGLPHGALDPALARRLGLWEGFGGAMGFHLAYLMLAGATVAAFVWAPVWSLGAFLVATAWHFSGDHRHAAGPLVRVATGTAIVSLPAVARPEQVGELYALVTTADAAVLAEAQAALGPLVVGALVAALVVLWRRDLVAAVEVLLAAAAALATPPLVFFALYFALLHAPRHLREALATTGGAGRTMVVYSSLAAAGLIAVGLALAPRVGADAAIAATVFVGLAALTTPHMLLVERGQQAAVLTQVGRG